MICKLYTSDFCNGLKLYNCDINPKFYDKENIKVSEDLIEVNYYLNKEETLNGLNKEFFSEFGAFKLEVPSFVENGYKTEIIFSTVGEACFV